MPRTRDAAKVVAVSASKRYLLIPLLGILGSVAVPLALIILALLVLLGSTVNGTAGACSVPQTSVSGNNTQAAYEYLAFHPELGLKPFQAAAMVGNFIHESGQDPISTNNPNPSTGATGIAHWLGGRLSGLKTYRYRGLRWDDINLQLDYLRYELLGTENASLLALKRTTSIEEATVVFEAKFERSGDTASYPTRIAKAISVRDRYAGNVQQNGAALQANCSSEAVDGTLKDPGEGPMDPNNGSLVPRAANLRDYVFNRWGCDSIKRTPCIREIGGQNNRPAGTPQDHTLGLALDITIGEGIGSYPDSTHLVLGWEIACFIKANAERLGVRYQIWQKLWWHSDGSTDGAPNGCTDKSGWSVYSQASDVTGGHYDHIHITVQPGVP